MRSTVVLAWSISKASDWECQDAFAVSERDNRFAVADGSSRNSFCSAKFAQLVADTFVHCSEDLGDEWTLSNAVERARAIQDISDWRFVRELKRLWRADVEEYYLPSASAFIQKNWRDRELGSSATFAGARGRRGPGGKEFLDVLVIGDCYVFVCEDPESSELFSIAPQRATSIPDSLWVGKGGGSRQPVPARCATIPLGRGRKYVILATDWIGRRLHENRMSGEGIASILDGKIKIERRSDFDRWILKSRSVDDSSEPQDDATLVIIEVIASPIDEVYADRVRPERPAITENATEEAVRRFVAVSSEALEVAQRLVAVSHDALYALKAGDAENPGSATDTGFGAVGRKRDAVESNPNRKLTQSLSSRDLDRQAERDDSPWWRRLLYCVLGWPSLGTGHGQSTYTEFLPEVDHDGKLQSPDVALARRESDTGTRGKREEAKRHEIHIHDTRLPTRLDVLMEIGSALKYEPPSTHDLIAYANDKIILLESARDAHISIDETLYSVLFEIANPDMATDKMKNPDMATDKMKKRARLEAWAAQLQA